MKTKRDPVCDCGQPGSWHGERDGARRFCCEDCWHGCNLEQFKDSLRIVQTGKGSDGTSYNSIGTLNQAAWIGENCGCMIREIEYLRKTVAELRKARA